MFRKTSQLQNSNGIKISYIMIFINVLASLCSQVKYRYKSKILIIQTNVIYATLIRRVFITMFL